VKNEIEIELTSIKI